MNEQEIDIKELVERKANMLILKGFKEKEAVAFVYFICSEMIEIINKHTQ